MFSNHTIEFCVWIACPSLFALSMSTFTRRLSCVLPSKLNPSHPVAPVFRAKRMRCAGVPSAMSRPFTRIPRLLFTSTVTPGSTVKVAPAATVMLFEIT
jgi:hypothetical protein